MILYKTKCKMVIINKKIIVISKSNIIKSLRINKL